MFQSVNTQELVETYEDIWGDHSDRRSTRIGLQDFILPKTPFYHGNSPALCLLMTAAFLV
jgi:hypothetical protein